MEDLRHTAEGLTALGVAWAAHLWALMYPTVTGLTAIFALIYTGHAVCRLVWRWLHGYPNFLTDREADKEKRQ